MPKLDEWERPGAHGLNCKIFVNSELIFEIYDENYSKKKISCVYDTFDNLSKVFWNFRDVTWRVPSHDPVFHKLNFSNRIIQITNLRFLYAHYLNLYWLFVRNYANSCYENEDLLTQNTHHWWVIIHREVLEPMKMLKICPWWTMASPRWFKLRATLSCILISEISKIGPLIHHFGLRKDIFFIIQLLSNFCL